MKYPRDMQLTEEESKFNLTNRQQDERGRTNTERPFFAYSPQGKKKIQSQSRKGKTRQEDKQKTTRAKRENESQKDKNRGKHREKAKNKGKHATSHITA